MLNDRYDNRIATKSTEARDGYVIALDRVLGAEPYGVEGFREVVQADPDFALGHAGLARALQLTGDGAAARASMSKANDLSDGLSDREKSHINALGLLIGGKMAQAYPAIRAHVAEYPRDALLAQTCTSVFGLIGFSGQPGREAELLAYTAALLPHYGEDWWFLSQHAFSLCETGQLDRADAMIDRSLALNPRNAHAAHIRAHVYYEAGEAGTGIDYLDNWLGGYDRSALLHGHLSWHVGLWAMYEGDTARMWQKMDADVGPDVAEGLPINVLTDTASMLYRAELAGLSVDPARWRAISDYAKKFFAKPSIAFADVHAALAHAMAGETDALAKIVQNPAGPAADLVHDFSAAFGAVAKQNWAEATQHLSVAMSDHARIGGSRAQRDLLEHTLLNALLKQGNTDEANRLIAMRRPVLAAVA
jgi:tetratricopeptide (TPR) repeat protein